MLYCGAMITALLAIVLQESRPPNIVFLLSDDQRHDTIGNPKISTPHLDALAARGTGFSHAFIMGGNQGAVCIPSRAMLLTGRHLFRIAGGIPDDAPMWPEMMRREGAVTHGIGKWHNGAKTYARAFSGGAEIFFGGMSDQNAVRVHDFNGAGKYPKSSERVGGKFSTELFADAAVKFLQEYKEPKPFVLYVSFTSPHDPRTPPEKYRVDPASVDLPPNFLPEHPFDNGEMKIRDEGLAPWPRTPDVIRRHIADYAGMIAHLDAQIGRILDALNASGHAERTIVVFAGDNGLAVGQHGLMGKQNLYEHSVRVPLVMAGPGIPKGRRVTALCSLLDLFPTLCELTGRPAPEGLDGTSLVPLMDGRRERVRDSLFFAYRDVQRAVRDERWKLIEYRVDGRETTQLFDLAADPWETKSLDNEVERARLRKELADYKKRLGDPR